MPRSALCELCTSDSIYVFEQWNSSWWVTSFDVAKLDALYSGIFLTAQIATLIISRPPLGRLSDKKGRKLSITIGSLAICLLLFAVPFTTQFPMLLLLAVGYGFSFAMAISSTSPLISDLAPTGLLGSSMGF
jgi:MFS family permease